MREYFRTEGDALTIPYVAQAGTDSVIFSVYDLDLNEYILADEAVFSTGSTFNMVLPLEITKYDRSLRLEIQSINGNVYSEDEIYASIVRQYSPTSDIRSELGLNSNQVTNAQIERLERKARYFINSKIGEDFSFSYKTIGTLGQGTDQLYIGLRTESFDKITKDDKVIYDSTEYPSINELEYPLAITKSKYNLKIVAEGENISEWSDVSVLRNPGFFTKNSFYSVRGEFGWKYIPNEIKVATTELVNDMLCSDFSYRNKGLKSVKNDSFDIQFQDGMQTSSGNLLVDSILSEFKRFDVWAI
jgi:hypothetical protein